MSAITHERPTTVTDTAVSVDNLTVQFSSKRGDVTALSDVDLKVGEGEFVSIAGPSGCGKSTLLKVVAGLTGASRGSVELAGREVKGRSATSVTSSSEPHCWNGALSARTSCSRARCAA